MRYALLGASKGINNYVLRELLGRPSTSHIVVLLRNSKTFDNDPDVSEAINAGRVRVVKGDATNEQDVAQMFTEPVDVVISSIGGTPTVSFSGAKLTDPTVCTRAAKALVSVLAKSTQIQPPRVIVISSMGIGKENHIMPLPLRIIYPWLLSGPHEDKEGLEFIVQKAGAHFATPGPGDYPPQNILSESERDAIPEATLPELIILRPALLNDSKPRGRPALKAGPAECVYLASRKDVALFIVNECLPGGGTDEWVNTAVVLGY